MLLIPSSLVGASPMPFPQTSPGKVGGTNLIKKFGSTYVVGMYGVEGVDFTLVFCCR